MRGLSHRQDHPWGGLLIVSVDCSLAQVAQFGRAGLAARENRSGSTGGAVNVRSMTLERQLPTQCDTSQTLGLLPMDQNKVQAHCDELRDLIGLEPGRNPEMLAKTLGVVRLLRGAAEWNFPQHMLGDLKERLAIWFSDRAWRVDTAELHRALVRDLDFVLLGSARRTRVDSGRPL